MKVWHIALALVLSVGPLSACGSSEPTPAPPDAGLGDTYISEALDVSYTDALNASSQLMLGALRLEATEYAVTAEQAKALLPLWQALEGGGLQSGAERSAVLNQIEGNMSSEQLQAIAAMRLSPDDLRSRGEEQGLEMGMAGNRGASPGPQATRGAQFSGGNISPEMATRRAQMENMSEGERAAFRATAQAGGGFAGGPGGAGAGARQPLFLLGPLIALLEARAGEG